MKGGRLWFLLLLGFSLSCAVPVPPSGGPEDKTPPSIVAIIPSHGSTGVDVRTSISFTFSEKMTKSKIERLIFAYPSIEIGKVQWEKNSITIFPADPLKRDTTYLVIVKPGFRDVHNVGSKERYQMAFATSAHIDSGIISGIVKFRRKPTAEAVVRCFRVPRDSSFYPESARPDRETFTDNRGSYSFPYLPTRRDSFIIWAFQDQNGNAYFEKGKEFGEVFSDTVLLTPDAPLVDGADIVIVDPTEPGEVSGTVINETGIDTIPVSVGLFTGLDSLPQAVYYTFCDMRGSFMLAKVKSGSYSMKAFIDFERDSLCGTYPCLEDTTRLCREPCAERPDSLRLAPGEKIKLEPLVLGKKELIKDEN